MPIQMTCTVCGQSKAIRPSKVQFFKVCSNPCRLKMRSMDALAARPVLQQPDDYKLIPLTRGLVCLVSNEDYEWLARTPWSVSRGYATHRSRVFIHQLVARRMFGDYPSTLVPDHVNRNRLDNRRENLRLTSQANNSRNVTPWSATTSSRYVGVSLAPFNRWKAYLSVDYHRIHIGSFDSEEEAAWHRDQWCIALHGEFAVLNYEYI